MIAIIGGGVGVYSLSRGFSSRTRLGADEFLKKKALLGELVETIIPTTDTPGAKAAMVHEYIISVMLCCTDIRQQNRFYIGLQDVEKYAQDEFGNSFLKSSDHEKQLVVSHFATRDDSNHPIISKIKKKIFGEPFYIKLRQLTIEGYCQSRIGATQTLNYDSIPGKYLSRVPMTPNQKSWATK